MTHHCLTFRVRGTLVQLEVFTAVEEAMTTEEIKSGKAAGEDEIRPKMLKVLIEREILWLTQVCEVARKISISLQDWQTGEHVQPTGRYYSLICQEKYINALKRNAKKLWNQN